MYLFKNVFPLNDIYSTHLLSMDALLAVVDSIEQHCHNRTQFTQKSESSSTYDGIVLLFFIFLLFNIKI